MESTSKFAYWGTTSEEILTNNFPLHKACRDGDVEALSKLLIHAQHGIYVEDNFYGWTPAHWCAYFGHWECLSKLRENRTLCDVTSSCCNQSPLHLAAFAGSAHAVKFLLLLGAHKDRQLACLKKLMSVTRIGAECNINTTRFQQTPAHLAAFGGHPQCLQWLIESNADIEIQDYLGETPIHKAARSGSMACVSILASNGSRLYMKNNNNQTAADLAAVAGYAECAEFLTRGAQMQEHLPVPGVYNGENSKSGSCTVIDPSPHDVTLTEKFHPCVGNGTVSQSSDMEMEDDSEPHGAMGTALSPRAQTRDITIDLGVSKNQVPIAGRKRSREESDEDGDCFKRIRTQDFMNSHDMVCETMSVEPSLGNCEQGNNGVHAEDISDLEYEQEAYAQVLAMSVEPLKLPQHLEPCDMYRGKSVYF